MYKTAKISITNIFYSGIIQRTSVDAANLAAFGLPFVICLSTYFGYITLFVMNKCNNSRKKWNIANAVPARFRQTSTLSKGLEQNAILSHIICSLFNECLLQSKYYETFYLVPKDLYDTVSNIVLQYQLTSVVRVQSRGILVVLIFFAPFLKYSRFSL